jgi:5-methylcytosine-specific restriction endonuclease McrA
VTKEARPTNKRQLVLGIVRTDNTFTEHEVRGERMWVGKCIHCDSKLVVAKDGTTAATIEHIEPKHHGGDNQLENLALACARCNAGKGVRLDHRKRSDKTLSRVVTALKEKRIARWRDAG